MDALHNLGIDWKILIAQVINFGVLLFLLTKFLYRPMLTALEKRKARIAESLKKADEIEKQRERAEKDYSARLQEAKREAEQIILEAKTSAENVRTQIIADAEAEAATVKASAREQIETERRTLYADVKKTAGKLALFVITKILKEEAGEEYYKKSVERALEEIEG
jgi:F-type H+-transporting ATPase subunit b